MNNQLPLLQIDSILQRLNSKMLNLIYICGYENFNFELPIIIINLNYPMLLSTSNVSKKSISNGSNGGKPNTPVGS